MEPISSEELQTLLLMIFERYGVDFRDYSEASLRRRITSLMCSRRFASIAQLHEELATDSSSFQRFVHRVSVNVTSMFRDPSFYLAFRNEIVPMLATYPFIRVWHAGCSTGEEVYSMAVILSEEGLYDRVRLYATDLDGVAIERAKQGIFPLASMKEYSANYLKAGGKYSLSKYFRADHENVIMSAELRKNIVFAQHNLASDASFNEFHVVFCRNVLIYFNDVLRERVLNLFHDSLVMLGILGLGSKESLRFSSIAPCYQQLAAPEKLYRKVI